MNNITFDDLTFLVCIANVAGYMEKEEKISIDSDSVLAGAALEIYEEYKAVAKNDGHNGLFASYAEEKLANRFGIAA